MALGEHNTILGQISCMLVQHLNPGHALLQQGQVQHPRTVEDPLLICQGLNAALHSSCRDQGGGNVAFKCHTCCAEFSMAHWSWHKSTRTGSPCLSVPHVLGVDSQEGRCRACLFDSRLMLESNSMMSKQQLLRGEHQYLAAKSARWWPTTCVDRCSPLALARLFAMQLSGCGAYKQSGQG